MIRCLIPDPRLNKELKKRRKDSQPNYSTMGNVITKRTDGYTLTFADLHIYRG